MPESKRSSPIRRWSAPRTVVELEPQPGVDVEKVWRDVAANLNAYLVDQRLANVDLVRASEPPEQSARSGKFRQVIAGPSR